MKFKILLFVIFYQLSLTGWVQNLEDFNGCPTKGEVSPNNPRKEEFETKNRLKNRYNIPRSKDFDKTITLEDMIGEDGVPDAEKFDEKKAVAIEGYVVYAAKKGSKETCNCKSGETYYTDQHIEIALSPDEKKEGKTVVVEITPRLREIKRLAGEDWTHAYIIENYLGKKVRVAGWLFYDKEHEKQACSYHPELCGSDVEAYNRQTCWEIHPVTSIDVLEDEDEMVVTNNNDPNAKVSTYFVEDPPNNPKPNKSNMKPIDYLVLILLGGILGAVGQLLRVVVGIKKSVDSNEKMDYKRTILSLVLAFAVGGVAGVLSCISMTDINSFDKSTIFIFLAAGYAGTDFIEGFIRKNPTVTKTESRNEE